MHSFSRGAKRLPTQSTGPSTTTSTPSSSAASTVTAASAASSSGLQIQQHSNMVGPQSTVNKRAHVNNVAAKKRTNSMRTPARMHRGGKVAASAMHEQYDNASNTSTISSPGNLTRTTTTTVQVLLNKTTKRTVSGNCYSNQGVVVIDSSPDEEQRIMDYDDDNDKEVKDKEVSLSSVAHAVDADEMSAINAARGINSIASIGSIHQIDQFDKSLLFETDGLFLGSELFPSVSDLNEEHQQQTIDETDEDRLDMIIEEDSKSITIDSSDEDGRAMKNPESPEYLDDCDNIDTSNSEEHFTTTEEEIMSMDSEIIVTEPGMKTSDDQMHEDFEEMIDSGNSKDGKESNSSTETDMGVDAEEVVRESVPTPVVSMAVATTVPPTKMAAMPAAKPSSAIAAIAAANQGALRPLKILDGKIIYVLPKGVTTNAKQPIMVSGRPLFSATNVPLKHTIYGGVKEQASINLGDGKKYSVPIILNNKQLQQLQQQQKIIAQQQEKVAVTEVPLPKTTSQPSVSYPKLTSSLSSLSSLVTQDTSLPTRIFEDESISPDSSIEQDESDLLSDDAIYPIPVDENHHLLNARSSDVADTGSENAKSPLSSNTSGGSTKTIEIDEMLNDEWKRKNVKTASFDDKQQKSTGAILSHLINKSRETSQSPVQAVTANNARLSSIIPQLSPLSQPNEIQSNIANSSQQLRSIMSSINRSKPGETTTTRISSAADASMKTNETQSNAFESVSGSEQCHSMLKARATPSGITTSAVSTASTIIAGGTVMTVISKDTTDFSGATAIRAAQIRTHPTTSSSSSLVGNNAVIIGPNKIPMRAKIQLENVSKTNTTITVTTTASSVPLSLQQQPAEQSITIAKTTSILSNTLSQPQQTRIVPYNNESHYMNAATRKMPTMLVTSTRQSMNSIPVSHSSASSTAAIQSIIQSSLQCQPTGSILSATLNQPSTQKTTPTNTLLHTQLTNVSASSNVFR